jgi:3-isopropylmalate/(R)-2-methylmalate dehydratase small subunit
MSGRAFVFGDNVDTDTLAPGAYMRLPPRDLAGHCLEAIDPAFANEVRPGDFVIAGSNFGLGSSREQAAVSLKLLGVEAVIARSFARIFYRNAMNLGLLALTLPPLADIAPGAMLSVDAARGLIKDLSAGRTWHTAPIPEHLLAMIAAGGLIPHLKQTFRGQEGTICQSV